MVFKDPRNHLLSQNLMILTTYEPLIFDHFLKKKHFVFLSKMADNIIIPDGECSHKILSAFCDFKKFSNVPQSLMDSGTFMFEIFCAIRFTESTDEPL